MTKSPKTWVKEKKRRKKMMRTSTMILRAETNNCNKNIPHSAGYFNLFASRRRNILSSHTYEFFLSDPDNCIFLRENSFPRIAKNFAANLHRPVENEAPRFRFCRRKPVRVEKVGKCLFFCSVY